ncbi:hypothetical protein GCM10010329_04610 [Streptomyces spiroverticillatus]|uniref:Uncharacterized protein n=1 Tax=Streptomyces finlayi TaxID=67296 RepID=A0A918WSS6_9ACTN|nr:hypothetical protein GCM10010329_04610 [Streptomyces spiroverticillatus]GHC78866.1 hypothetical protein GCM10010334_04590 [Streptomyces finlayi]
MATRIPRRHLVIACVALVLHIPLMQAQGSPDSPARPEAAVVSLTP